MDERLEHLFLEMMHEVVRVMRRLDALLDRLEDASQSGAPVTIVVTPGTPEPN